MGHYLIILSIILLFLPITVKSSNPVTLLQNLDTSKNEIIHFNSIELSNDLMYQNKYDNSYLQTTLLKNEINFLKIPFNLSLGVITNSENKNNSPFFYQLTFNSDAFIKMYQNKILHKLKNDTIEKINTIQLPENKLNFKKNSNYSIQEKFENEILNNTNTINNKINSLAINLLEKKIKNKENYKVYIDSICMLGAIEKLLNDETLNNKMIQYKTLLKEKNYGNKITNIDYNYIQSELGKYETYRRNYLSMKRNKKLMYFYEKFLQLQKKTRLIDSSFQKSNNKNIINDGSILNTRLSLFNNFALGLKDFKIGTFYKTISALTLQNTFITGLQISFEKPVIIEILVGIPVNTNNFNFSSLTDTRFNSNFFPLGLTLGYKRNKFSSKIGLLSLNQKNSDTTKIENLLIFTRQEFFLNKTTKIDAEISLSDLHHYLQNKSNESIDQSITSYLGVNLGGKTSFLNNKCELTFRYTHIANKYFTLGNPYLNAGSKIEGSSMISLIPKVRISINGFISSTNNNLTNKFISKDFNWNTNKRFNNNLKYSYFESNAIIFKDQIKFIQNKISLTNQYTIQKQNTTLNTSLISSIQYGFSGRNSVFILNEIFNINYKIMKNTFSYFYNGTYTKYLNTNLHTITYGHKFSKQFDLENSIGISHNNFNLTELLLSNSINIKKGKFNFSSKLNYSYQIFSPSYNGFRLNAIVSIGYKLL